MDSSSVTDLSPGTLKKYIYMYSYVYICGQFIRSTYNSKENTHTDVRKARDANPFRTIHCK